MGGADYTELVKKTIEAVNLPEIYSRDRGVMAPYTDVYKDMQEMARQCNKSFCLAKSFVTSPPCSRFHHSDKFQPEAPTFFKKKKEKQTESFNPVVFVTFHVVPLTELFTSFQICASQFYLSLGF